MIANPSYTRQFAESPVAASTTISDGADCPATALPGGGNDIQARDSPARRAKTSRYPVASRPPRRIVVLAAGPQNEFLRFFDEFFYHALQARQSPCPP